MKFTEILKKANHNTWNRKWRSVLTILSVTVGATTLTLAVALGSGAQSLVQSSFNSSELKEAISVRKIPLQYLERDDFKEEEQKGVPEYDPSKPETQEPQEDPGAAVLTEQDRTKISGLEGVEAVYPIYRVPALFLNLEGKNYLANVVSSQPNMDYKPLQGQSIAANQTGILLAQTYAESLGIPDQELLNKPATVTFVNRETGKTATRILPVIGVMSDVFGIYQSQVNYDTAVSVAQELNLLTTDSAVATIKKGHADTESILSISKSIENLDPQIIASSPAEERGEARTAITIFRIGLISFASIVLLAALFGISNTLLMSVLERTQDIGLMRALGAKRSNIFAIFAAESALIGFWGAVVGIAIGFGLGAIGNAVMRHFQPEVFTGDVSLLEFNLLPMLSIVATLAFISFLAGTLPARKAAKTNVISALRYE